MGKKASVGHAKASISMLADGIARSIGMESGAFWKIKVGPMT
jgi:hypothetical protein